MDGRAVTTTRASRVTMKYATDVSNTVSTGPEVLEAPCPTGDVAISCRSAMSFSVQARAVHVG